MIDNLSEEDLNYLAGMIDSRGSLFCQKVKQPAGRHYNYLPLMTFQSKDSKRTALLAKSIGMSVANSLQLGKNNTVTLLKKIHPRLRYRKKMVTELLKIEEIRANAKRGKYHQINEKDIARMEAHYQRFLVLRDFRDDGVDNI